MTGAAESAKRKYAVSLFVDVPGNANGCQDQSSIEGKSTEREKHACRVFHEITPVFKDVEYLGTQDSQYKGKGKNGSPIPQ